MAVCRNYEFREDYQIILCSKVLEHSLKLDSPLPKNIICFNDSPSKMMKSAFYFILKALFLLKIFKFLS